MELYEAFDRAVTSTAGLVKAVRLDQAGAPTPCTEWDVRDLLNHIIGTLWLSEALLSDHAPRHPMAPGGLPGTDLAGPDPAGAYAEASAAALTAASAGDSLTRVHPTPLGDMPGPALAGFTTLDVLAFAEQAITPGSRAPSIGPAVPTAANAPLTDRLVAFLGRQP